MDTTIETNVQAIVPAEPAKVLDESEDLEAKIASLEVEKSNYKMAYLKEKSKKASVIEDEIDESDDDKISRKVREEIANSRLTQIALEQDTLIKKALKENKELKLAQLNRTGTPPATVGTHQESQPVRDTIVTPDQMSAFKAKGWSDKDIERYKKNLQKYGGR